MTVATLASELNHAEAVAWHPSGHLVCGGERGELYAVDVSDGHVRQFGGTDGRALGLALDGSDRVYVCDAHRRAILRVPLAGGEPSVYAGGDLRTPNSAVFDGTGNLWFSDSGRWGADDGRVFVVRPGGELRLASTSAPAFTNGLALSPDGAWLYVAESSAHRVVRLPLDGTTLGSVETVVALAGVPDGLAFTAAGELVIACYRPDAIYLHREGELHTLAHDPDGITLTAPTNVAFFGEELQRLAVANLQASHLAEVPSPGLGAPLERPRGLP